MPARFPHNHLPPESRHHHQQQRRQEKKQREELRQRQKQRHCGKTAIKSPFRVRGGSGGGGGGEVVAVAFGGAPVGAVRTGCCSDGVGRIADGEPGG